MYGGLFSHTNFFIAFLFRFSGYPSLKLAFESWYYRYQEFPHTPLLPKSSTNFPLPS